MVTPTSNHRIVTQNILRFAEEVRNCPDLVDRLSAFRAWYAVRDKHGRWHFGPSKFVGYAGLDGDEYISITNSGMLNGRATEDCLQAFFRRVDPDTTTTLYEELNTALCDFLAEYHKLPCRISRINITNEAYDDHLAKDDNPFPVIDLIVAVARSLPSPQVKELRKRLKTMSN